MANDTLDIEQPGQLLAYLRATGRLRADEPVTIRNLAGGVSNRTVLLERPDGEGWVLKQALAKLRVEVDWFSDPVRIQREAMGLRWLDQFISPEFPGAITPLVFEDRQHHLLAMRAVPQPHDNLKTLLLAGRIDHELLRQFGGLLGAIHRQGHLRRAEAAAAFEDRSFFESLRLEPYYHYTATQTPAAAAFLDALIARTRATRLTLVHGDYSPKNILVRHGRLVLLDHEVIHWGDPAFDLGFGLTHLFSKAHHLRLQRQALIQGTLVFWRAYGEALGDMPWRGELEPAAVRHTLACLLARVAGRSTLEYLAPAERMRQQQAVVALMQDPPEDLPALMEAFARELENHAHD